MYVSRFKILLTLYLRLVAELPQISYRCHIFLLHSSIGNWFCLVVLRNNDDDKISLKFLFILNVKLIVFCGKISSIYWLLYEKCKWYLMMLLNLGNKGLCCVTTFQEIEKVAFCDFGFLASSLVSFLIFENCFFTLPGL